MAERAKHLFEFTAATIAEAAKNESAYHDERIGFWQGEMEHSRERVKATAGVKFVEQQITGGTRLEVVVDYGDPTAYARMNEAWAKITKHRQERDRFASDAMLYGTQAERPYDLDGDDVAHFRLNGRTREE